ncbi:DUF3347 domain-containing protein [Mucilaginibacter arboris]|uniref:DUF3347 domain-containing protein n=1 Tax=Mucilaginibacter arboris TaxID=2682090 RepID=A0A7K1SVL5_9SPHI|nr:DUF3347 domain-containing protein [Mucilaginibacter arboris]MVN21365.1 DUF3347 domain-containing protein [Mucilaginibacter arboris]
MKNICYLISVLFFFSYYQTKAQNSTTAINQVLQAYFGVEKALVNDDSEMANKQATVLVNAIEQVNASKLDDRQKADWTKYNEKLRYNSQHISESKSIAHQREHFAALSDDMYSLFKNFKTHPTIYRQYCPMKKQYWLNDAATIQNPYYGKQMPDCGKVTEKMAGSSSVILIK